MTPGDIKHYLETLEKLEWHYFDKTNKATEDLTEDYHKHLCLTIAAKTRELRLLIQNGFTSKQTLQ